MSTLDTFISRTDWPAVIRVEDAGWLFDPDIVDGLPVWEWPDVTRRYTTRVCLEHRDGPAHWQVWEGTRLISDRPTIVHGVLGALNMINGWRRAAHDAHEVRRVTEFPEDTP